MVLEAFVTAGGDGERRGTSSAAALVGHRVGRLIARKAGVTRGYRIRLEPVGIADVVEGTSCT